MPRATLALALAAVACAHAERLLEGCAADDVTARLGCIPLNTDSSGCDCLLSNSADVFEARPLVQCCVRDTVADTCISFSALRARCLTPTTAMPPMVFQTCAIADIPVAEGYELAPPCSQTTTALIGQTCDIVLKSVDRVCQKASCGFDLRWRVDAAPGCRECAAADLDAAGSVFIRGSDGCTRGAVRTGETCLFRCGVVGRSISCDDSVWSPSSVCAGTAPTSAPSTTALPAASCTDVACAPSPCREATCNPTTGRCDVNKPDGTACGVDGGGDRVCAAGACVAAGEGDADDDDIEWWIPLAIGLGTLCCLVICCVCAYVIMRPRTPRNPDAEQYQQQTPYNKRPRNAADPTPATAAIDKAEAGLAEQTAAYAAMESPPPLPMPVEAEGAEKLAARGAAVASPAHSPVAAAAGSAATAGDRVKQPMTEEVTIATHGGEPGLIVARGIDDDELVLAGVEPHSPAEVQGLTRYVGRAIVHVNHQRVRGPTEFFHEIHKTRGARAIAAAQLPSRGGATPREGGAGEVVVGFGPPGFLDDEGGLAPGTRVKMHSLDDQRNLNGCLGTVVRAVGRGVDVRLRGGAEVCVPLANVLIVPGESAGSSGHGRPRSQPRNGAPSLPLSDAALEIGSALALAPPPVDDVWVPNPHLEDLGLRLYPHPQHGLVLYDVRPQSPADCGKLERHFGRQLVGVNDAAVRSIEQVRKHAAATTQAKLTLAPERRIDGDGELQTVEGFVDKYGRGGLGRWSSAQRLHHAIDFAALADDIRRNVALEGVRVGRGRPIPPPPPLLAQVAAASQRRAGSPSPPARHRDLPYPSTHSARGRGRGSFLERPYPSTLPDGSTVHVFEPEQVFDDEGDDEHPLYPQEAAPVHGQYASPGGYQPPTFAASPRTGYTQDPGYDGGYSHGQPVREAYEPFTA